MTDVRNDGRRGRARRDDTAKRVGRSARTNYGRDSPGFRRLCAHVRPSHSSRGRKSRISPTVEFYHPSVVVTFVTIPRTRVSTIVRFSRARCTRVSLGTQRPLLIDEAEETSGTRRFTGKLVGNFGRNARNRKPEKRPIRSRAFPGPLYVFIGNGVRRGSSSVRFPKIPPAFVNPPLIDRLDYEVIYRPGGVFVLLLPLSEYRARVIRANFFIVRLWRSTAEFFGPERARSSKT